MYNILSTYKNALFHVILKLLSENRGTKGFCEYGESIRSHLLNRYFVTLFPISCVPEAVLSSKTRKDRTSLVWRLVTKECHRSSRLWFNRWIPCCYSRTRRRAALQPMILVLTSCMGQCLTLRCIQYQNIANSALYWTWLPIATLSSTHGRLSLQPSVLHWFIGCVSWVLYRVCQQNWRQQALFMEKLRRMKFWQTQVVR